MGVRKIPIPGPGTHEIAQFPAKIPHSGVGSSVASTFGVKRTEAQRKTRVGPGAYHPNQETVQKRVPGCGFGRGAARILSATTRTQVTPGPALAHQDNPQFKAGPKHGFASTAKFFKCPAGIWPEREGRGCRKPAPGEHDPDDKVTSLVPTAPAYSVIPRRAREPTDLTGFAAPGPGAYKEDVASRKLAQKVPGWGFGIAKRKTEVAGQAEAKKSPDPGRYVVENRDRHGGSSMFDSAPKWTMPSKGRYDQAKYL
eukprot:TRINITY_DN19306_c0_g2_i1.p1 TRINITY_DN19306_c0_g2~~TRINITY_DN19306_c0_g2_i1.p1  ORF type:complete len:255 (-),score=23.51 TRINITY_DN19306_c0_g2_i1:442-1206(-)